MDKTPQKLTIDVSQSSEKFQHFADEIICFLIEILQEIHTLEKEIFERSSALKNPDEPHQVQPGEKELWTEFTQRRKVITAPASLKPTDGGSNSFGKPTKYEYLSYSKTKVLFIMKSAKRAVVEIQYEYGIESKDQFVLKRDENGWKVATKKYGFQGEDKWYKSQL
ncbi:MAG: hypothetical protein AB8B65_19080 [Kordia sp.]|uniref:hypothetical protein n=1 Tax=Kordia sp. TaxID=1965332 RepID=UPI0038589B53